MHTLVHALRVAALLGLLAACAAPEPFSGPRPDTARKAAVSGVPLIQQADYYCGPASLAMVLQWSGHPTTQSEIARQSFTPGARGTYLADMAGAARRQGQIAATVKGFSALLREVEAGHPVIVFQNLGVRIAPIWHYGVVTAYDLEAKIITLNSGQNDVMRMPLSAFLKSWDAGDRWAMVLLPPDQLPVTVDEVAVLRAVAALERVGESAAAEIAYRSGAARWPENWLWPFGLGNALYAQGKLKEAANAFQKAVRMDATALPARNNLAQVQRELG